MKQYVWNNHISKYQQIQNYFTEHEKLGYTIFVQSPLCQPVVHRNEKLYRKFLDKPQGLPIEDYAGAEGIENIKRIEGQFIEAYRLTVKTIPAWNKTGGNVRGQKAAIKANYYQIIKRFSEINTNNVLVSRSSLRELAENPTYEWFEVQLHGLRMMMLTMQLSFEEEIETQLKFNPYFMDQWNRIIETKYLDKKLVI